MSGARHVRRAVFFAVAVCPICRSLRHLNLFLLKQKMIRSAKASRICKERERTFVDRYR